MDENSWYRQDYPRLTPYLAVDDCATAIDFYCSVLGATERMRMTAEDGRIGHAELEFGDSLIMLADENAEIGHIGPKTFGGSPVHFTLYVNEIDSVFALALSKGAKEVRPLGNRFYGDRTGGFEDPFGHVWYVSSRVEDVEPDEMMRRAKEEMASTPTSDPKD